MHQELSVYPKSAADDPAADRGIPDRKRERPRVEDLGIGQIERTRNLKAPHRHGSTACEPGTVHVTVHPHPVRADRYRAGVLAYFRALQAHFPNDPRPVEPHGTGDHASPES